MLNVVKNLRSLYQTPSRHRAAREATLAPLFGQVRALRTDLTACLLAHEDIAVEASTIDTRQLARYLKPDLLPVAGRARDAAVALRSAGNLNDLADALYLAQGKLDDVDDRQFEAAVAALKKLIERAEGSVRAVQSNATVLVSALKALTAAQPFASDTVNIPKSAEHGFTTQFTSSQPTPSRVA